MASILHQFNCAQWTANVIQEHSKKCCNFYALPWLPKEESDEKHATYVWQKNKLLGFLQMHFMAIWDTWTTLFFLQVDQEHDKNKHNILGAIAKAVQRNRHHIWVKCKIAKPYIHNSGYKGQQFCIHSTNFNDSSLLLKPSKNNSKKKHPPYSWYIYSKQQSEIGIIFMANEAMANNDS